MFEQFREKYFSASCQRVQNPDEIQFYVKSLNLLIQNYPQCNFAFPPAPRCEAERGEREDGRSDGAQHSGER